MQAINRHAGDLNKQAREKVKGLMMMVMAFAAYSGVTRRPALSARLRCHSVSHLLPPHTLGSLLTLSLSFHHSQPPPQFPGSFMSLLTLQRTAHLRSLSPARMVSSCTKVISLLTVRRPGLDLCRLFWPSAAAEVLQKAQIIQSPSHYC